MSVEAGGVCTRKDCRRLVAGPWPDLCPTHGAKLDEMCAANGMSAEMVGFLKALAQQNAERRAVMEVPA